MLSVQFQVFFPYQALLLYLFEGLYRQVILYALHALLWKLCRWFRPYLAFKNRGSSVCCTCSLDRSLARMVSGRR